MLKFTIFNVLEKLLSTAVFFYLAFSNQLIYNLIESEVAFSAIFITVLDLGLGSYPFFLKGAFSKSEALRWISSVKSAYIFILIILILFAGLFDFNIWLSRSSVLCALLILKNIYRIEDKMMEYFKVSFVYPIGMLIFATYPQMNFIDFSVAHYSLSILTFTIVVSKIGLSQVRFHPLKNSIQYSWPLMFQSFVYVGLFNVQRIYLKNVTDFELSEINFNLRLSGFFLLAFSSMMYFDNNIHYHKGTTMSDSLFLFLKRFTLLLLASVVLITFWALFPLKYGLTIHFFYWMPLSMLAYQELLLAKNNRNIHNLISALICLLVFVFFTQFININLSAIFFLACLSSIIYRFNYIYNAKG